MQRTGVRGLELGTPLLSGLCEESQRRFQERRASAIKCGGVGIPPLLKASLNKELAKFKDMNPILTVETSKDRLSVRLFIGHDRKTRNVTVANNRPSCECGSPVVTDLPCGCMLVAAEAAGWAWTDLIDVHDGAAKWHAQYTGLVEFVVPGTEQLEYLERDKNLFNPVAKPIRAGRPTETRKRGLVNSFKASKRDAIRDVRFREAPALVAEERPTLLPGEEAHSGTTAEVALP